MSLFGSKKDISLSAASSISGVSTEESTLALVRNRLKPHFINNVLSSIYYLCDSDTLRAQSVSTTFSAYLMSVIEALNSSELIPFAKELDLIKSYMLIEDLRLEDRLRVDYDIYISDFKIPPLSIESLVEISVKRNIAAKDGGGSVVVSTRRLAEDGVQIKVTDTGIGFDPENPEFGSEDIDNVRSLLKNELNAEFSVNSAPGHDTEFTIVFYPKKAE